MSRHSPSVIYLHPKQMEVYRTESRFKVVVAGRRWGKALALDTPIPTPLGWTTMGDLKQGDLVFDEAGKPCKVVYAHDVMYDRPCYEVEFSDGEKVIADGEHLWSTWTHAARKNSRRNPKAGYGPSVCTTEEIAKTLTIGVREDSNHSIQCALPVEYSEANLPIDPYIFGMWLGDGDSRCAAITCGSDDLEHVLNQVEMALGARPSSLTQDGRSKAWRVSLTTGRGCESGIQKHLRDLDALGNKHIPRNYLESSVEQRIALLQGLMDSDGTCNGHAGNCEFTSTSAALASGTLELALSLGIKATMTEGRATLYSTDCGAKYRVKFSTDLPIFRMERKLARLPKTRRFRIDHRFIKAVRLVASVPVRCITVDSPNSLYLCTRSFIPTHNTQLAKTAMLKYARVRNRLIWYVAPSYRMAKQIMWPELIASIPKRWIQKINETTLSIKLVNGTRLELKGADNPDSLRGVGIHFLVMDEVQDIDREAWSKVLRPTLASTGGHALFIGTPKAYNFLYELYALGQIEKNQIAKQWRSWQFPTMTSPFIPLEEIEAARDDMDEKSFNQEFNASFETMSGRVYHSFDRKLHLKKCEFNPALPIWIGQDFNIDPMSSVIMQPQEDGTVWAIDEIVLFGSNTEEACDEIERKYWRHKDNIVLFPDPASQYRQHARGESDLDIFRERGIKKQKFHRKHPAVADRVNAVNRMLKSAKGAIRFYVDPKCKHLIQSLEQTIYKKGGRDIDKDADIEHSGDALGYCIEFMFPVRNVEIIGVSI
mgnify:CR=1 FL=1